MTTNPATLSDIRDELVAIRLLLAARPAAAAPAQSAAVPSTASGDGHPPQPSQIVENPGSVQVHFGKNNGKSLAELSERSLAWYATEQPPRLDSSGKPYPPRPQEITLRNAARTLWHKNKGTLVGHDASTAQSAAPAATQPISEEEVPF